MSILLTSKLRHAGMNLSRKQRIQDLNLGSPAIQPNPQSQHYMPLGLQRWTITWVQRLWQMLAKMRPGLSWHWDVCRGQVGKEEGGEGEGMANWNTATLNESSRADRPVEGNDGQALQTGAGMAKGQCLEERWHRGPFWENSHIPLTRFLSDLLPR